jgi:hypothetical protein
MPPAPVSAWKSNAHVFLAEIARLDALDGTITLPRYDPDTGLITSESLGPYPVDPKIRLALELCPDQYRAGALGPDAYPDAATGQLLIHPDNQPDGMAAFTGATNTSQWINRLWDSLPLNAIPTTSSTCTADLAKVAFATGFLTHTAGDMYGHTFINYFAGGAFDLTDNALQHVIIEGYVDKLIPDNETPNFYDISIWGADQLIYDVLVKAMPGSFSASTMNQNKKVNFLSLPRLFNSVRKLPAGIVATFDNMTDYYDEKIDYYLAEAEACDFYDMTCSATGLLARASTYALMKATFISTTAIPRAYYEAWIEDIDDGLWDWVQFSQEVALTKLFKPDAGRPDDLLFPEKVADFITLSFEPMTPLPDAFGVVMRYLIPLGYPEIIDQILMAGDNFYDYILDFDLYAGITMRKLQDLPLSPASLFDVVVYLGNGPKIYRQEFRREILHLPPQTGVEAVDAVRTDPTLLALVQQAKQATGFQRTQLIVAALDRASTLEKMLTPEVLDRLYLETLDYQLIPAMRNTVAMDKLIMISREGMDQLLEDTGYRCNPNLVPTPIMLGTFVRSLDESDQGLNPFFPDDKPNMGLGPLAPDHRPLMGIARDPVAYRTIFQLQEGHSPQVLSYLNQTRTQCPADPDLTPCTENEMTLVASFNLPSGVAVNDIAIEGNRVYLTAGQDGLYILGNPGLLNGSDPLLGHLQFRENFYAQNILIDGDRAFISNGQTELISVNITNPAAPVVISDFTRMEPGVHNSYATDTFGIVKSGNHLFVSAGYNGVLEIDITTDELQEIDNIIPQKRLIQNPLEDPLNVVDVDLMDSNTLLVTTNRYLFAYDITPTGFSPIMLGYIPLTENAYRTTLGSGQNRHLAYVADGRGGLQIFNASGVRGGSGFTLQGWVDLIGLSSDVAIVNNNTAIVSASSTLYTVDTSNFTQLKVACPIFESATRVLVHDNHLYTGEEGILKVFNLP